MPSSEKARPNGGFVERILFLASPLVYLSRNLVSLVGVVLTTSSFFTILVLVLLDFYRSHSNPYIGILAYLILPGIFVAGLLLIPTGILWRRRRQMRAGVLPAVYPQVDFNEPRLRLTLGFVALATTINGLVLTGASYQGVEYMDSASFCGQACHTVMTPEFTAYQNFPHSRVDCVECHIGEGATWFVRAKLSGISRLAAMARNDFPRPIPTPIENLRAAQETCEQCHWGSRSSGYLLRVRNNFGEDEANHQTQTVLALKVAGSPLQPGGIHSTHLDPAIEIAYLHTDGRRQVIPWVQVKSADGTVKEYAASDWDGDRSRGKLRTMDCLDCHNRPAHTFEMPSRAVNQAMASGRMDPSLPFLKKTAMELLLQEFPTRQEGMDAMARGLSAYYQANHPEVWSGQRQAVEGSAAVLAEIYGRNVFPEMKVTWGTYPNNIGHEDFPGCFRCHDGDHTTAAGEIITQDCAACHTMLAYEEDDPEILSLIQGGL